MSHSTHTPTKVYPDITSIKNSNLDKKNMIHYLHCILRSPKHHINTSPELQTFDKLADIGLRNIIIETFKINRTFDNKRTTTETDKQIEVFEIETSFTDAVLDYPKQIDRSGLSVPRNPDEFRIQNESYFADITISMDIRLTAFRKDGQKEIKEISIDGLNISSIPIMIGSSHCNTRSCTPEMLKRINEDPTESRGYFIVGGKEYVITATENLTFNTPLIFKSTLKTQKVYATMLSQKGGVYGNSTQIVVYLNTDNSIVIELQTYQFSKVKIPFYNLYRMFGVCSDKEIAKMIVYEMDQRTNESNEMLNYIIKAFLAEYKIDKNITQLTTMNRSLEEIYGAISSLANPNAYKKNEDAIRMVINQMREKLDESVLPHVGQQPSNRASKLLHISTLIRDAILVDMGLRPEDDRDHVENKRVHGASLSLAKTIKTLFNAKVIQPIQNVLFSTLNTQAWDTINMQDVSQVIKTSIGGSDLKNAMIKFINASEKEGTRNRERIRMVAVPLERKNKLNAILTFRQINTTVNKVAKSTKRGEHIRFFQSSAVEIICPAQTPETGDKVGTVKQLAITAIIYHSEKGNNLFKEFILKDEKIQKIIDPSFRTELIAEEFLAKIIVDGEWIGVCKEPYNFVKRYRLLRREGTIDRFISIVWDPIKNIIYFWLDSGRLMRPLLIVDNNLDDFNSGKTDEFVQNILLSDDDLIEIRKGNLTFEELLQKGYIEYIYPGEEVLLCPSIEHLRHDRNDFTKQWTHCSVEQALFGMAALIGPFLNRNQAFRNTMVTIHSKQSCGQPMSNAFTSTLRQQRFHMTRVHVPLVKTMTQEVLPPNSQNAFVLYAIFLGYNQEDSSIVNRSSVQRGLTSGLYFKMEKIEIEKNQTIQTPKERETMYVRTLSYNKLAENGIVPFGTIVNKGDIIIGRVVELANPTPDGKRYVDKSVHYDNEEPGKVVGITQKLEGEEKFIQLTYEYVRELGIGDKMSTTRDHDVLTSKGWIPISEVTLDHKVACLIDGQKIEYHHPIRTIAYDYEGDMYEIENQLVSLKVTANHEMWCQRRHVQDGMFKYHNDYTFHKAKDIYKKRCKYLRNAENTNLDIEFFECGSSKFKMNEWLKILGLWIADGYVGKERNITDICFKKERKYNFIKEVCDNLNLEYKFEPKRTSFKIYNKDITEALKPLSVGASNKYLPDYVWNLSQQQSRILLDALIEGDGSRVGGQEFYCTTSIKLRDDLTRLCLHSGYSGNYQLWKPAGTISKDIHGTIGYDIVSNYDLWRIGINKNKNQPEVNHGHVHKQNAQYENLSYDKVRVYCLEVPSHVFYIRRNGRPCWTGNSSRSGNKNICGAHVPAQDMPQTRYGLRPDIILNPASIPTRMTLAQLFETAISKLCAVRGKFVDGTVYTKFDIHELVKELEDEGLGVREQMINGITGEMFDMLLFTGPQTIFRLPKFVKEDRHAIGFRGAMNKITGQPLTGKRLGGGHKVGEMEQWVMLAQGTMATLYEEFYYDSDKKKLYICRECNDFAIYNEFAEKWRCNSCKDDADICEIDSSKTSLWFAQTLQQCNIKLKLHPEPRIFEEYQK